MKNIFALIALSIAALNSFGQAAFVFPSPTNANGTVDIYIDVAQTTGGLKAILNNHPDAQDSVYMWTWQPAGPACGNGEWGNSNDCMLLTQVQGLLYKMTVVPTQFYSGITPLNLYQTGISCLAKLKSGYAYADDGVGEAKTEDLHIDIVPALCADRICLFPEAAKQDDFLSITYDNLQETDANLQNLGTDECYIFLRAFTGSFTYFDVAIAANVTSTPSLKMKDIGGGKFRITFIPEEFIPIPAGSTITKLAYYIVKPGYIPNPPPYIYYVPLNCD
jgi:hypothetical protein